MQHKTPHTGDVDFSLVAMGVVMALAIVFLALQFI